MGKRDKFLFHRSFYNLVQSLPKRVQNELYPAVAAFAFEGIEPKLSSDAARMAFAVFKAELYRSDVRRANGLKGAAAGVRGGRPRKVVKDAPKEEPKEEPKVEPKDEEPDFLFINDPVMDEKTAAKFKEPHMPFEEEVAIMLSDLTWNEPVCMKFHIAPDRLPELLDEFLTHCNTECMDKPHTDINDAKRHFCSWFRKAYPPAKRTDLDGAATADYSFDGGFGGLDT